MKKTIALFLVAALLGVGLIVSCSDDPEPEKKPGTETPPVLGNFKVTFDPDGGTFVDTESTAVYGITVKEGNAVGVLPDVERGTDQLLGWFEFGNATAYTSSTKITKDVYLKASWGIPTLTVVGSNSVTHDNFKFTEGVAEQGNFTGTNNGDNSFVLTLGGIRYKFPETVGFDYNNYDFIDVEYTASQKDTAVDAETKGIVYKQYASGADYLDAGVIKAVAEGKTNVITYEIRKATQGGIALQKWDDKQEDLVIAFTKVTFRKGTRYTIKLDTDGGSKLPDTYLVDGTKIRKLLPTNTTKDKKFFAGWMYPAGVTDHAVGDAVSDGDVVDSSFNNIAFKALWLDKIENLAPLKVTVASLVDHGDTGIATVVTKDGVGIGFKQTKFNWEWTWVSFKITIPAGVTLAHYDTVSFDITGEGDYKDKPVWLVAGDLSDSTIDSGASNYIASEKGQYKDTANFTLNIVKPLTAGFTGDVDIGIIVRSAATSVTITNIEFK